MILPPACGLRRLHARNATPRDAAIPIRAETPYLSKEP